MSQQKRQPYPSDLTEAQFKLLEPLIKKRRRKTGRPPANQQEVINGMFYVLSTGCRWRDLPHDFGISYITCYRQFINLIQSGKLQKLFEELKYQADKKNLLHWRNAYLDASVVKSKKGVKNIGDIQENIEFTG